MPINWDDAKAFIESVPAGRWTSYTDVAVAAGSPRGAQAIGKWLGLASWDPDVILVYRVLNKNGEISAGWGGDHPGLPRTRDELRDQLAKEGIRFQDGKASGDQRWTADDWRSHRRREP